MSDRCSAGSPALSLPRVSRARGYRLYAESGVRYLDLWQCGGAAVLGHCPAGVLLAFKDSASRGLFAPFPSPYAKRLERLLSRLVPGREAVRVYADAAAADRALADAGLGPRAGFADPALEPLGPDRPAALWRPWIEVVELPPVVSPVLPLPHPGRPTVLLLSRAIVARFPESPPSSPVMLAAACRAVADLLARLDRGGLAPALGAAVDAVPGLVRRGPYLRFPEAGDASDYADLFRRFLARGLLLPPDPSSPAVVPAEMSPGEERSLVAALAELRGLRFRADSGIL